MIQEYDYCKMSNGKAQQAKYVNQLLSQFQLQQQSLCQIANYVNCDLPISRNTNISAYSSGNCTATHSQTNINLPKNSIFKNNSHVSLATQLPDQLPQLPHALRTPRYPPRLQQLKYQRMPHLSISRIREQQSFHFPMPLLRQYQTCASRLSEAVDLAYYTKKRQPLQLDGGGEMLALQKQFRFLDKDRKIVLQLLRNQQKYQSEESRVRNPGLLRTGFSNAAHLLDSSADHDDRGRLQHCRSGCESGNNLLDAAEPANHYLSAAQIQEVFHEIQSNNRVLERAAMIFKFLWFTVTIFTGNCRNDNHFTICKAIIISSLLVVALFFRLKLLALHLTQASLNNSHPFPSISLPSTKNTPIFYIFPTQPETSFFNSFTLLLEIHIFELPFLPTSVLYCDFVVFPLHIGNQQLSVKPVITFMMHLRDPYCYKIRKLLQNAELSILPDLLLQKLVMEVNCLPLGSIGVQNGNILSTVRQNRSPFETPEFAPFDKQPNLQNRKLRLQYEQLMRKKALKKKIEAKFKGAEHRLQEIKQKQLMNFTQNQKKWYPHSQEKKHQSPKYLRSTLQNNYPEQQLRFKKKGEVQKQNAFQVYHKAEKSNELPKIKKERIGAREDLIRGKNQEIDLVTLGIFSEKTKINVFLKKFRSVLEKQFVGGLDLKCEQTIQRLEDLLLNEVGSSRSWLTTE